MMLIFDSGDPGGDAIIEKVYYHCIQLYECTYVGSNESKYSEKSIFENFSENNLMQAKCYIFSSSVNNKIYLKRLKKLKDHGVYTIHILDSWSNYIESLKHLTKNI